MVKLPIYELFVEDSDMIGLALVDSPAIEKDFMYFNEEIIRMSFNDDKMMIKGPALIPNQLIYRNDKFGERYVYFSEETIIKFVELLMSKEKDKFNLEHTDKYLNAVIIESYFTNDNNEFKVPKGSWVVSLKIKDLEVWKSIKKGNLRGFSIQSMFSNELVKLMSNKKREMSKLKTQIAKAINSVIFPSSFEENVDPEVISVEEVSEAVEEMVEITIDEKLKLMKDEILLEVDKKIEDMILAIGEEVAKVDEKVEEFGKQPLAKSVKESVTLPNSDKGVLAYFSK